MVRNIDPKTTNDELRKVFEAFGEIRDVYTPLDHYTKKPRGFGFIEFRNVDDTRNACDKLNGSTVGDNIIEVVIAQQRRKSPGTMRKIQGGSSRGRRDDRDSRRRSPSREVRRRRSPSNDRRRRSYSR